VDHPLGCTGTKLTVQMIHESQRRDKEIGLIAMYIGCGIGVAGIIQRLS
jgi:acetyl-CoA acyltransferase